MRPNANPLSHVVQKPIAPPEISFLQAQGKLPWLRSIYTFPNITLTSLISMKVEWNVYFKHFITITSFTNLESSLHLWHALPLSSCPFQLGHFSYGFIGFVSDQLHPGFNLNLTISKNNPTLRLNASKSLSGFCPKTCSFSESMCPQHLQVCGCIPDAWGKKIAGALGDYFLYSL